MQSRDKIAYLGALSLLMSLAELFVPRPLPFFRLGLANIPLLLGLTMDVGPYMALLLVKAIGNSYVSGTIFSPFALMSLAQTFASGMAMYGAGRLGERISIYSVSLLGAAVSSAVQIAVAALYAGRGVTAFLPLMLAVALPSSLLVAYIAKRIRLPEALPEEDGNSAGGRRNTIPIAAMAITVGSSLMLDSIPLLLAALMASLCFQRATGRRIRLMPHIWTMAFMVLSSLMTPEGRVLSTILSFPITENALISGVAKALRLSCTMALSQGFSTQLTISSGLIGRTLYLFSLIEISFRSASGSLKERILSSLELKVHNKPPKQQINITNFTLIAISFVFLLLIFLDILIF